MGHELLRRGVSASRWRVTLVGARGCRIVPWLDDGCAIFADTLELGDTPSSSFQLRVAQLNVFDGFGIVLQHTFERQGSAFEFSNDEFEFNHGPFKGDGRFVRIGL